MNNTKRPVAIDRYDLRDEERAEVLALFSKLTEIAGDIDRLIDGTLPDFTPMRWSHLRKAVINMTADIRRLHRWNRWRP